MLQLFIKTGVNTIGVITFVAINIFSYPDTKLVDHLRKCFCDYENITSIGLISDCNHLIDILI